MTRIVIVPETHGQRICKLGIDAMDEGADVHAIALSYDDRKCEVSIGALRLGPDEAYTVLLLALSKLGRQLGR